MGRNDGEVSKTKQHEKIINKDKREGRGKKIKEGEGEIFFLRK